MNAKKIDKARKLYDSKQHTVAEIAEMLHVSVATIYRHLDQTQPVRWLGSHGDSGQLGLVV